MSIAGRGADISPAVRKGTAFRRQSPAGAARRRVGSAMAPAGAPPVGRAHATPIFHWSGAGVPLTAKSPAMRFL